MCPTRAEVDRDCARRRGSAARRAAREPVVAAAALRCDAGGRHHDHRRHRDGSRRPPPCVHPSLLRSSSTSTVAPGANTWLIPVRRLTADTCGGTIGHRGVPVARPAGGPRRRSRGRVAAHEAAVVARAPPPERERGRHDRGDSRRALGRGAAADGDQLAAQPRLAAPAHGRRRIGPHTAAGLRAAGRPWRIDLHRFQGLVEEAERVPPETAARKLREALALWRGTALSDLANEPFALAREARRLEELRVGVEEELIAAELASGRDSDVVAELEALRGGAPAARAAPGAAHARALPRGPAGGRARGLPGGAPRAPGRARARPRARRSSSSSARSSARIPPSRRPPQLRTRTPATVSTGGS